MTSRDDRPACPRHGRRQRVVLVAGERVQVCADCGAVLARLGPAATQLGTTGRSR